MKAEEFPYFNDWFSEYKRLGGTCTYQIFAENLSFFFDRVLDPWISGDLEKNDGTYWRDTSDVWNDWMDRVGSYFEADVTVTALCNVTSIYFKRLD